MGRDNVPEIQFDASKDYYGILGIAESASLNDVKQARNSLRGRHSDKGGTDAEMTAIIDAYKVLSGLLSDDEKKRGYPNRKKYLEARARYIKNEPKRLRQEKLLAYQQQRNRILVEDNQKNTPIPKKLRRKQDPTSYQEMLDWLQADAKQYPSDERFTLGITEPQLRDNLWKLIETKRLSYAEYQSLTGHERRLLANVFLRDSQVTQQFCERPEDQRVLHKLQAELVDEAFNDMDAALTNPLTAEEQLFLYLLTAEVKLDEGRTSYVGLRPFSSMTVGIKRVYAFKLENFLYESRIQRVREYRNTPSSLKDLQAQLVHRDDVIDEADTDVLEPVYDHWVAPIEQLIESFAEKTDDTSKIRVKQLNIVLDEARKIVKAEIEERLKLYEGSGSAPESERAKRKVELFQKIITLNNTYVNKEYIGGHRNKIGAVLKTIGCWFVTCLTLGAAARIFDGVRHGLFYRTNTKATLLDQNNALRELHRKADPEGYKAFCKQEADNAPSNPYLNALMFRSK